MGMFLKQRQSELENSAKLVAKVQAGLMDYVSKNSGTFDNGGTLYYRPAQNFKLTPGVSKNDGQNSLPIGKLVAARLNKDGDAVIEVKEGAPIVKTAEQPALTTGGKSATVAVIPDRGASYHFVIRASKAYMDALASMTAAVVDAMTADDEETEEQPV